VVRANSITLSLRVKRLSHGEPGQTVGTAAADDENLSHPMNLAPGQAFVVLPKADQDELEAAGIAFAPSEVTRLSGNLPDDTHPPTRTGGFASRIAFYWGRGARPAIV